MCSCYIFMFFTQNTAYDFRISDWSSDVFSSDLYSGGGRQPLRLRRLATGQRHDWRSPARGGRHRREHRLRFPDPRKSSFRERQPACPSSRIERQEHQVTRDSKERYGRISRFLHWGMALLIGWQLLKIFDRVADGEHWIGQTLVPWHVSIGTLLLLLIALRTVRSEEHT